MTDPRKPVFDAVKERLPEVWNDAGRVQAMDNLLDAFGYPRAISAGSPLGELPDKAAFYTELRKLTGRLNDVQVRSIEAVLAQMVSAPIQHNAYVLATGWHEARFEPQEEWGKGKGRPYAKPGARMKPFAGQPTYGGQIPYGRGLVQVTWAENYERLDEEAAAAGLIERGELLADFDLALRPDIAVLALVKGMQDAWYASNGKPLAHYGPKENGVFDYVKARQTVNVLDKADQIAGEAVRIERALRAGGGR